MTITRAATAAALAAGLLLPLGIAVPAQAATETISDPAGDAGGAQRLDMVEVRVSNLDDRVTARVDFARERAGDLIVSIDPRGGQGVRLVAQRRRDGSVTGRVLTGAFIDRSAPDRDVRCAGFRVRWRGDSVRLDLPSTCLGGGNYGAIRFAALTENGSDSDAAPGRPGSAEWIARG